jgi:hypothetical protein
MTHIGNNSSFLTMTQNPEAIRATGDTFDYIKSKNCEQRHHKHKRCEKNICKL